MVEVGVDQGPLPQPDEVGCPYVVGLELCGNEGHELVKEIAAHLAKVIGDLHRRNVHLHVLPRHLVAPRLHAAFSIAGVGGLVHGGEEAHQLVVHHDLEAEGYLESAHRDHRGPRLALSAHCRRGDLGCVGAIDLALRDAVPVP